MSRIMVALMAVLAVSVCAEDVPVPAGGLPAELRPRYTMYEPFRGGGRTSDIRIGWRHGDATHHFSPDTLRQVGMRIREIFLTPEQHDKLRSVLKEPLTTEEGHYFSRWNRFMLDTVTAPDEVLWVTYTEPVTQYGITRDIEELEPQLSLDDIAFEKTLWHGWLPPLPEGYEDSLGRRGHVSVWRPYWRVDCRRTAQRLQSLDKNNNMMSEQVFWFDRPLSFDEALRNLVAVYSTVQPVREYGHRLLRMETGDGVDRRRPQYGWQSGQFLIYVQVPSGVADEVMERYLEQYPPTWDAEFVWDPTAQTLRWMDEALALLRQGLDDPPNHLRYTFTWYPFDQGVFRVNQIAPGDSPTLLNGFRSKLRQAHESWSTRPDGTEPVVAEYVASLRAIRQEFIDEVTTIRARIAEHGIVFTGPGRRRSVGDNPE